jgi:uncharacterized protein (TIGR02147 family)
MSIYEYLDYTAFIKDWIKSQPKKGRGIASKMALSLRVSTTMISQVLNGDRQLSLELASDLADFIGLNTSEQDYFFLMIDFQRAGTQGLKNKLKRKLLEEQSKASKLKERLKVEVELSETAKAVFYSDWIYSGVRNLSAVPEFKNVDSISEKLHLPRAVIQKVVDFLLRNNLLILKNGMLQVGPQKTHIGAESLLVNKHHQNWRLQGFREMLNSNDQNLFYTGPMSLSNELAAQIRQEIPTFIERLYKRLGPSESETVRCLNIDWFEY